MDQKELDRQRACFKNYVAGFYGDDESVNAGLKLKEDHTARTCTKMLYLADELGLSDSDRRVAETIALFHDVGRFEQFTRYRPKYEVWGISRGRRLPRHFVPRNDKRR